MSHDHGTLSTAASTTLGATAQDRLAMVGNPNVGKSVLFSHLTGAYVTVSNYPGTTVAVTRGPAKFNGAGTVVFDTPGINSLVPRSEDERVTRDLLIDAPVACVMQVLDAKNLARGLTITTQLAELGLPIVLVFNMMDEARTLGFQIDADLLSRKLDVPVFPTVAVEGQGVSSLVQGLDRARPANITVPYPRAITDAASDIATLLPEVPVDKRGLALLLLADDPDLLAWLEPRMPAEAHARVVACITAVRSRFREPLSFVIARARAQAVKELLADAQQQDKRADSPLLQRIGDLAQHPVWGLPIVALVLYAIYWFVGVFAAGTVVGLIENGLFGTYINPWATRLLEAVVPWAFVRDFFVGEYGQLTMGLTYAVAIVLPVVGFFFIAFGLLEDSGYLPRLTILANRVFKRMGLNGKAVLPMVLGLGCDTMATLTTRILDTRRERMIATFLLALAVPCSAQLGVILGILGSIAPSAFVIFFGVILAELLLVGWLAGRLVPGRSADFLIEIPPFRVPKISNVLIKTVARVEWFLKEAVPLFLLGTAVVFGLDKLGVLDWLIAAANPIVVSWLGLPEETTVTFIMGFLRRDYGAAGLYALFNQGLLSPAQVLTSLVVITLFVPCVANYFAMVQEQGFKRTMVMVATILPLAVLTGGLVYRVLAVVGY